MLSLETHGTVSVNGPCTRRRRGHIEEECRRPNREVTVHRRINHKQSPVEDVPQTITYRRRIDFEACRLRPRDVIEYRAAFQVRADGLEQIFPSDLEKRMARCDPVLGRVLRKVAPVEVDLLVFFPSLPKRGSSRSPLVQRFFGTRPTR